MFKNTKSMVNDCGEVMLNARPLLGVSEASRCHELVECSLHLSHCSFLLYPFLMQLECFRILLETSKPDFQDPAGECRPKAASGTH